MKCLSEQLSMLMAEISGLQKRNVPTVIVPASTPLDMGVMPETFALAVWAETFAIPALTKAKELAGEGEGICNTIWDSVEQALKELPK